MYNLIRRDVILQKKHLIAFIPFIIFFIIMGAPPAMIYLVASIFIPFNTYAYDEKAETNILLNSLPYTRKEIIASRYLGAIVYMLVSIGLVSLALFLFNKPFTLTDIAIGGGLFLFFSAITFPLFHLFKPGYITTVILIGFVMATLSTKYIPAEVVTTVSNYLFSLSATTLYMGAAVVVMVFYLVSWTVSTIIYQRKAF